MSRVVVPDKDMEYSRWLADFARGAAAYADELGFSAEEVAAFAESAVSFREALLANELAKYAAAGAVARKNSEREASEKLFRNAARVVNADANITNEMKARIGIAVSAKPFGRVAIPKGLMVVCEVTGLNKLTWNPNINAPGTQYVVEVRKQGQTEWSMIGICTAHKFVHTNQRPGVLISYRVTAVRAGNQSVPSMAVDAYAGSATCAIEIKPAA